MIDLPGFEREEMEAIQAARKGEFSPDHHFWLEFLDTTGRYVQYHLSRPTLRKYIGESSKRLAELCLKMCRLGQAASIVDPLEVRAGSLLDSCLGMPGVLAIELGISYEDRRLYLQTARAADARSFIVDYLRQIPLNCRQVLLVDCELGLGRSQLEPANRQLWQEIVNQAKRAQQTSHFYFPRCAIVASTVAALHNRPRGLPLAILVNMLRHWPDISLEELAKASRLPLTTVKDLLARAGYHPGSV